MANYTFGNKSPSPVDVTHSKETSHSDALCINTNLNNQYLITGVIGRGGYGITYSAVNIRTSKKVAIKEFFPVTMVKRCPGDTKIELLPNTERELYNFAKEQFLTEAQILKTLSGNNHVIQILNFFEENNTCYFSMEYTDGCPLNQYVKERGGRLSVKEAKQLLLPLMRSVEIIHGQGIIHRDIAPDNIIIQADGNAKLLDFGNARYNITPHNSRPDSALKRGFSPIEMYSLTREQGPYTDIYSMAATYYYTITGKVIPEAVERSTEDRLVRPSVFGVKISSDEEDVLFTALNINSWSRYQNMGVFCDALERASHYEASSNPQPELPTIASKQSPGLY